MEELIEFILNHLLLFLVIYYLSVLKYKNYFLDLHGGKC